MTDADQAAGDASSTHESRQGPGAAAPGGPRGRAGGADPQQYQEAIQIATPAVALLRRDVGAEITIDCGQGRVTVTPAPFVETGTAGSSTAGDH